MDLLTGVDGWLANLASTPASTLEAGRLRAYAVYLLARQGIKPAAALANVEQELANRHAPAWKTDLAAAYLASTYRLLQRTADADRLIAGVPWSPQKAARKPGEAIPWREFGPRDPVRADRKWRCDRGYDGR